MMKEKWSETGDFSAQNQKYSGNGAIYSKTYNRVWI